MRIFALVLFLVLAGAQYYLWAGKNGWYEYKSYQKKIHAQELSNQKLIDRNNLITTDIKDLREGTEGIEESARSELGFIKPSETFIRIITKENGSK
ncbi:MAG: cell division protein FtsB [Succinivibrionaceae bacterium]